MSITLAGITLPKDMYIENLHAEDGIIASTDIAIDGTEILTITGIQGRALDLISTETSGWIDGATLKQLEDLVKTLPTIMTLDYYGQTFQVRFRYEDSPVLEFTPLVPRPNEADTDLYFGIIKLKEVG